jgi:hypothetical protein
MGVGDFGFLEGHGRQWYRRARSEEEIVVIVCRGVLEADPFRSKAA